MLQTDEQKQAIYEAIVYLKTAREALNEAERRLVKLQGYNLLSRARLDCAQRLQLNSIWNHAYPIMDVIDKQVKNLTRTKFDA